MNNKFLLPPWARKELESIFQDAMRPLTEAERLPRSESELPLTVAQFADRMNGSRQWIHDLIRKGLIPTRKLGGKTVIYPSELKKVLPRNPQSDE